MTNCTSFHIVPIHFIKSKQNRVRLKRIISITLVILLFLSETSIAFAIHYCGGKLVSVQFEMGQAHNGCAMDDSDCDSKESQVSKSRCCANSMISIAQTNTYEIFTFNWLIIRMPASHLLCEQVLSFSCGEHIKRVLPDPPPIRLVDRSRLQVYII